MQHTLKNLSVSNAIVKRQMMAYEAFNGHIYLWYRGIAIQLLTDDFYPAPPEEDQLVLIYIQAGQIVGFDFI